MNIALGQWNSGITLPGTVALQSRPMRRYKSVKHRERGRAGKPSDKEERPGQSEGREGSCGGWGRGRGIKYSLFWV